MNVPPPDGEPRSVLDGGRPPRPVVPKYRKALAWGMICGGVPLLVMGMVQTNPAARMNIMLVGLSLIVWGVAIRFQHIRF